MGIRCFTSLDSGGISKNKTENQQLASIQVEMESRFQDDNQTSDEEEEEEEDEACKSRYYKRYCSYGATRGCWSSGRVEMDPRRVEDEWNRVFLLVSVAGLFVDPLFFYALSISRAYMCVFVDGWLAIAVTVLRCAVDALHLWNMWLHLKLRLKGIAPPWSKSSLLFDLFVILPLPQIAVWVGAPMLLKRGSTNTVTTVFLAIFVLQYLPKIYHAVCTLRRMQSRTGYIFGTIWWGFALNMLAYFVASHAAGACWFLLGFQRAARCLTDQCNLIQGCNPHRMLAAQHRPIYYGDGGFTAAMAGDPARLAWAANTHARSTCLDRNDSYDYGAYGWVIYLVANDNRFEKILMPIFWGLMTMSTFGNLAATAEWVESVFVIVVLTSGLLLVTMLIGNIKVFLHATTSKKQGMQLRMRSLEWWMKKRKLPPNLKQRVRNYEWQKWAAMRGVDECDIIRNLPQGLRRDIKYHLCLDLVRQVPLFQHMDELVLENICDRVKSLIFTKGETITREGDPVKRMLFIVRGHLHSSQVLREGVKSSCMLGPGNFSGDELLSWCLRRPFVDRLPPSSSTLVTLETTEALELEAEDVKYVTQHFRYTFVKEKVRRSARYYSPGWRTWAAVAVQLAWRRHKHRLTLTSLSFIRPRRPLSRSSSLGEDRLRLYAALLTSPKPNPHDFDF